jgi:hypothetical protein
MNPTNLYDLLLERLSRQGVDPDDTHGLLRDLKKIVESKPEMNPAELNSKLHRLGWNGVALDYQSLQLVLAWVEMGDESKPVDNRDQPTTYLQ